MRKKAKRTKNPSPSFIRDPPLGELIIKLEK